MHKPHYFTIGFLFVLFVVFEVLIVAYMYLQNNSFSEKILNFIWSSLIFLFIMTGIIVISLFLVSHWNKRNVEKSPSTKKK
jgi:hypothetical protein